MKEIDLENKMKKKMVIGFFGAEVFNGNMGCLALTYSLISILNKQCINRDVEYYFFVRNRHGEKERFCLVNRLDKSKVHIISCINMIKKDLFLRDIYFKKCIKKCDLIIDLTQGDSFTDIYGNERFDLWTTEKEYILQNNIPLILGPQTYGPFISRENEKRALDVIQRSQLVFARDEMSYRYIKNSVDKVRLYKTCDLAFALPYNKNIEKQENIKRVGINISGLLWTDEAEDTEKAFTLKTDYQLFTEKLLSYFLEKKVMEIYLISHVSADYKIAKIIKKKYPTVNIVDEFHNPIEAKSFISTCDLFIGARMHATIAAISTGVPVIPIAYSRKFTGLFKTLDYPFVVDLNEYETNKAVEKTIQYINNIKQMENRLPYSMKKANELLQVFENEIRKFIG